MQLAWEVTESEVRERDAAEGVASGRELIVLRILGVFLLSISPTAQMLVTILRDGV